MQVSIDFNRKLNQDEKERFSVAIDSCTAAVTVTVVPGKGKKRKRSLKLKTEKQKCVSMGSKEGERFEVVSPEMLETLAKPYAPNNTQLNTQWAMNNFKDWWKWHNSFDRTIDKCPEVVLTPECSAEELNAWLPVYVSETRNKEGKRYSPKTIYSLLVRILRYMTENPRHPNFLEKNDPQFVPFHGSIDNVLRKLREDGVGAESKQTATITIEEEKMLWDRDVLNSSTPKGLFRAVFYYNGKKLCTKRRAGA